MNIKKATKIFLFLYLSIFLMAISYIAIAQEERPLEIEYPEFTDIPDIEAPVSHPVFLTNYIRYLYQFAVIIGGLVAFVAVLIGGFRYLTSAGSPGQMTDAREQIMMGLLGLIVILGSFVLLNELNPDLVSLVPPHIVPSGEKGIVIYSDDEGNDCGNGSDGQPGVFFELPMGTQYIKIKGTQSIDSFNVTSFWASDAAPVLTEVAFFQNNDCSGTPLPGFVFSPDTPRTCIPTGTLPDIECVALKWHLPGVWLFSYENGDPDNPNADEGVFANFREDAAALPKGLRNDVQSIAIVPDERRNVHYGVILHEETGARTEEKGWAHLYIPSGTDTFLVPETDNHHARSITVFEIDQDAPNRDIKICENIGCACQPDGEGVCQDASITFAWGDLEEIPWVANTAVARAIILEENSDEYEWWEDGDQIAICGIGAIYNWIGHITWRTGGCFRGVSAIDFEEGSHYIAILYAFDGGELTSDERINAHALVISGDVRNLGTYDFNELTGIIFVIKVKR